MDRRPRTLASTLGTVLLAVATSVVTLAAGAGPASALAPAASSPVRQLVAERGAASHVTGQRVRPGAQRATAQQVAERAAADDDDLVDLSLAAGCAKTSTAEVRAYAFVYSPTKATYDYVLTGTGGLHKTGSVKVKKDDDVRVSLPSLRLGSYRVVLTVRGASTPSAEATFDVLRCVQVKASCAAVTLTNPAGNPTALVTYGPKRPDAFDLELAPGRSRKVRIDDAKVVVEATSTDDDAYADLGSTTVKVKQSCKHGAAVPGQNAVQTSALSTCGGPTATGLTSLSWAVQKSVKDRTWEILAGQEVVAEGSYKHGGDKTVALAPGSYTYRSRANKASEPFEEVTFSVLHCVAVTTACHRVDVTNPNDVALEAYLIDTDEDSDVVDPGEGDGPTTLAPRATTSIGWRTRSVVLLAVAGDVSAGSGFISIGSDFPLDDDDDFTSIEVPQDC